MFHVEDGLCFERMDNGDVRIIKRHDGHPSSDIILAQTIDADAWASVIATMSKGDEIDSRFYAAKAFHESEGEIEIKKKTVEITEGFGKPIVRGDDDENDHLQD